MELEELAVQAAQEALAALAVQVAPEALAVLEPAAESRPIDQPAARVIVQEGELVLGIVLLLGTVWLATHLAVRIFRPHAPPPTGGPLA